MTPDQIIDGLIKYYTAKGVDLHLVLKDPHFGGLSLNDKIQVIKSHAGRIAEGTPDGMGRNDYKELSMDALRGAAAGGFAGFGTAKMILHALGKADRGPLAQGAIIGGILGASGGLMAAGNKYLTRLRERGQIRSTLQEAATKNTDESAFQVLIDGPMRNNNRDFKNLGVGKNDSVNPFQIFKDRLSNRATDLITQETYLKYGQTPPQTN